MTQAVTPDKSTLDQLSINAIRVLSMDAVQKAESGHPGTPMALAPLAYVLWNKHLRHNPSNPDWAGRDRFVLSCGHASMLLYSLLYLSGYELSLEEVKNFRQWGSKTPGHPEHGLTPGVETTTGPLGQGMGNAVGMAIAEAHLAAVFNKPGHALVDHHTYFIASDGDLMEGVSHEAASLAGHLKLGKLIGFFDDNHITIEGNTELACSDDAKKRFEAYGWHVLKVDDGNDLAGIDRAIRKAQKVTDKPSLIIVRTIIGYGSPNKANTEKAHGEALGVEEIRLTKENLKIGSHEPFYVPEEALANWRKAKRRGSKHEREWGKARDAYAAEFPAQAKEFERRLKGELPADWESALPVFTEKDGSVASRAASGKVLNAIASRLPELIGGSADLAGSTLTLMKDAGDFAAATPAGRNMHWGIREHGMGSVMNGMALHKGVMPYGATFLIFSDYMRPPIRLASLMEQHVIYVYTHDSIGLGEDGPTHQPVEMMSTLRTIPHLIDFRPGDSNEVVEAWRVAIKHRGGPVALVFTRQKLPLIDRSKYGAASGAAKGGYVLADAAGGQPRAIIMASGSELSIAMGAKDKLDAAGTPTRVVSMPSHALFHKQSREYRDQVLPPAVRTRLAIEAAHPMSWYRLVGDKGDVLGIEKFGASAPYQRIYQEYGLTVENAVKKVQALL